MQIQSAPSVRPEKNWTFAGAYHTSNIDSSFLRSVMCMQEVDPAQTNMVMEVYRSGEKPATEPNEGITRAEQAAWTRRAVAAGTLSAASLVGTGAMLGQSAIGALLLGGVGVCMAVMAAEFWSDRSQKVKADESPPRNPWHQESAWKETRTLELTASPSRSKVQLDSPQLATHKAEYPKPAELGARIADNLKAFPSQHTAVVLGAHGMGYQCWSDYSTDQVAEMLKETSKGIGDKVDLVFFDSCLMSNLEGLRKLAPHARYAVASEQVIYTSDRPWDLALTDLNGSAGGPEQMGKSLVKAMGGHNEITTFSLINLEKLEPLAQAVEGLAQELQDNREVAAEALDVHAFGAFHSRQWQVFGDLGQILENLEEKGACREATERCQQALKDAVVLHRTRAGYDWTNGLSIQIPARGFSKFDYTEETKMPKWGQLMAQLTPAGDTSARHVWKRDKGL